MKKILLPLIFLLFSLIFSAIPVKSLYVQPLEISIIMDESFIHGNTSKKITATNNYDYPYNVTWYVENPNPISSMRPNKTNMSDLSWIDVEPKWQIIPPYSNEDFYIFLDIPETKENTRKNWETWIIFKGGNQEFDQGIFNFEYAVRVYIDTPSNISSVGVGKQTNTQILPIALVAILILVLVIIGFFVIKKKKP